MTTVNQELLQHLFSYDGKHLYWKNKSSPLSRITIGNQAGCKDSYGYRVISLGGKIYKEHRLIWLYLHGQWPEKLLDHKSNKSDDNSEDNLRPATYRQNSFNRGSRKGSTSKYKGVTWHKRDKVWQSAITIDGKWRYLGSFGCEIEAAKAYELAAKNYQKDYQWISMEALEKDYG